MKQAEDTRRDRAQAPFAFVNEKEMGRRERARSVWPGPFEAESHRWTVKIRRVSFRELAKRTRMGESGEGGGGLLWGLAGRVAFPQVVGR